MISGTEGQGLFAAHDQLTGFCSRFYFLKIIERLDKSKHLPLSFLLGDIHGLKLINDVFGYDKGDSAIRGVAAIFKKNCRGTGVLGRWNGDEIVVALPQTGSISSFKILEAIKKESEKITAVPIKINVVLGTATKEKAAQDIQEILKRAEADVCRNKLLEAKYLRTATIASLVRQLGEKNYETEEHAWRMQKLALLFGSELGLTDRQMEELSLTVTLHDIGKLAVPEEILMKPGELTPEECAIVKEHAVRGYRLALSSNELAPVAPYILTHHERWDGRGYPLGLKGKEIPLLSRIVAIVDSYDVMINARPYKKAMSEKKARQELQRSAGGQFDPKLVKIFLNLKLKK